MNGTRPPLASKGVCSTCEELAKRWQGCQEDEKFNGGRRRVAMFEQGISFISNNLFSILTIANTLFLAFGVKWYEKRLQKSLSKELESYKSNLNKDIEKYKTELNLLHYRKLSFSRNEIDTLKELWSYFIESFYKFKNSCGICNAYPDITNMNEQDLNDYFKEADYISERDKIIILKSYNKQKTLENILDKNH